MSDYKPVFWVTTKIQPYQKVYAEELAKIGFDVEFFVSLNDLRKVLVDRRATMILFSDYGDDLIVETMLLEFLNIPDVLGAKLVLDSFNGYERIKKLAISAAFRDIIPSKMITREWIERFKYSTSSKAEYTNAPNLMLTVNMKAAASIPAKITRFGPGFMRVETKMNPEIGTTMGIKGLLSKSLGVNRLVVKVTKKVQTKLTYRFSQALELTWDVGQVNASRLKMTLGKIQPLQGKSRYRVFIVCSDAKIRASLFEQFKKTNHDIRTALSTKGMINDPKFFTPDLVIVENSFLEEENTQEFSKMCQNLTYGSTVIIVGNTPHFEYFQKKFSKIIIHNYDREVDDKVPEWEELLNPEANKDPNSFELPYNHDFSNASFLIPSRISKVHPKMGEIKFPLNVGDFGLLELDVKSLTTVYGKKPVIKLASYQKVPGKNKSVKSFVHKNVFYFADVSLIDRIKLNQWMAEKFYQELEIHGGTYSKFEKPDLEIEERSPLEKVEKKAKGASHSSKNAFNNVAEIDKSAAYREYAEGAANRRKIRDKHFVPKQYSSREPKYVNFLDMDIPAKQFNLVKNTLIVILMLVGLSLVINYVAKPRLTKVGEGYSDQFVRFKKYFGEKRGEFERNRVKAGKSDNLIGGDKKTDDEED